MAVVIVVVTLEVLIMRMVLVVMEMLMRRKMTVVMMVMDRWIDNAGILLQNLNIICKSFTTETSWALSTLFFHLSNCHYISFLVSIWAIILKIFSIIPTLRWKKIKEEGYLNIHAYKQAHCYTHKTNIFHILIRLVCFDCCHIFKEVSMLQKMCFCNDRVVFWEFLVLWKHENSLFLLLFLDTHHRQCARIKRMNYFGGQYVQRPHNPDNLRSTDWLTDL